MVYFARLVIYLLRCALIAIGAATWWLLVTVARVAIAFALATLATLAAATLVIDHTHALPHLPYPINWVVIGSAALADGTLAAWLTAITIAIKGITDLRKLGRSAKPVAKRREGLEAGTPVTDIRPRLYAQTQRRAR